MKNKKNHRIHFHRLILIMAALLAVTACTDPETARRNQLDKALNLQANGQSEEALSILQSLLETNPQDPELLQLIGEIYQKTQDLNLAAFYLEQAALSTPENIELLYEAYLALEAAGEDSLPILRQLATRAPEAMKPELWFRLGSSLATANETQAALDAYLKGIPKDAALLAPETANAIATLFLQLDNKALAERWFKIAAQDRGPEALTALLGLLEIKLAAADWPAAETLIAQLDQRFPGAVDASDWATTARSELQTWRTAQQELSETLKTTQTETAASSENPPAEPVPDPDPEAEAKAKADAPASAKSIAAEEFDAMEALANKPAIETTETSINDIQFDPSIAIQPADPSLDNRTPAAETPAIDPAPVTDSPEPVATPEQLPPSREQLLTEAEGAKLQRDFKGAIRLYWQALGLDNTTPETWSQLSQTYTLSGETRNAETTALEAVRLAPTEVVYTLDYLRIAQRSKSPKAFLAELKIAFDRFPNNPEITLSLARALQRISEDRPAATALYQQFIQQFPRHPLRPEAEAALATLAQPAP